MAIILNGITAKERWEGFSKGRSERGPTVTKQYMVPFASADLFVDSVMGGVVRAGSGGGITYVPRQVCPENPTLYATEAFYEASGEINQTAGGRPQFQQAIVTVTYGVLTWDVLPGDDPGGQQSFPNDDTPGQPYTYATQEIDVGGEFVLMPTGSLVFLSDNKPIDAPVGKWVAHATLRFTRHYVPNFPFSLIISKLNKINDATFLGQSAGKVRFANAKTHRVANSDGTRSQEVELVFEWREHDWNEFLRPDKPTFDAVGSPIDSSKQPYQYSDLRPLLSS